MQSTAHAKINFRALGSRLTSALSSATSPLPTEAHRSGLLVVLDLHGVLAERIPKREKSRLAAARSQRSHWHSLKNYYVWLRPHVKLFVELASARHDVAVWSSALPHTIKDLLRKISIECRLEPPAAKRMQFIWDRSCCDKDEEKGGYATLKRLDRLWRDAKLRERYTPENTLLLDDSESKLRQFTHSAILVPEYNVEKLKERYNSDDTLLWLLLYIEYLLQEATLASSLGSSFNICSHRERCMTLQDFIISGELAARQEQGEGDALASGSLALVHLQDSFEIQKILGKSTAVGQGASTGG